MNTKSPADFRRYILGTNPTVDDLKLIGSRLPTKKQVLYYAFWPIARLLLLNVKLPKKLLMRLRNCLIELEYLLSNDTKWQKWRNITKFSKIFSKFLLDTDPLGNQKKELMNLRNS